MQIEQRGELMCVKADEAVCCESSELLAVQRGRAGAEAAMLTRADQKRCCFSSCVFLDATPQTTHLLSWPKRRGRDGGPTAKNDDTNGGALGSFLTEWEAVASIVALRILSFAFE